MNQFPDDFNAKVLLERNYYNYDYEQQAEAKLNEARQIIVKSAYEARNKGEKSFCIFSEVLETLDVERIQKLAYELASRFPKVEFKNNKFDPYKEIQIDESQKKVTNLNVVSPTIFLGVYFEDIKN